MSWIDALRHRVRAAVRPHHADAERDEEFAFHASLSRRDFGESAAAARDFGNATFLKEEIRRMSMRSSVDALVQDLRYGMRSLRRAPAFTVVAVATLALGIGVNSAMFGVVDALLLRPPPGLHEAERLVRVAISADEGAFADRLSYPDYLDLRGVSGLAGVTAYTDARLAIGERERAARERVSFVTGTYFTVLGAGIELGRPLGADDDREGVAPVVVLSWEYFQRAFGGDRAVVGQSIFVEGQASTIVGVARPRFGGAALDAPAAWLSVNAAARLFVEPRMIRMRNAQWLTVVARLDPAATRARAASAIAAALSAGREAAGTKGRDDAQPRVTLVGLAGIEGSRLTTDHAPPVSVWLLAVTAIVLIIACANVANLLLARSAQRARELAVRASIGATHARLVRQLFTESALLALAGGIGGLAAARVAIALLPRLLALPSVTVSLLDGRTLAFTALLAMATTLVCGVAPVIRLTRSELVTPLHAATGASARSSWARNALVVVQLGSSVVLLVLAALLVRSLRNVKAIDPGFAVEQLIVATGDVRSAPLPQPASDAFWTRAAERVSQLPGVRAATLGTSVPFEAVFTVPAGLPDASGPPMAAHIDYAGRGYFPALGIPIVAGRDFGDADQQPTSAPVVIINRTMARKLFGEASPIGRCMRAGAAARGACVQVVGVAADVKYSEVTREPEPFFYRPLGQRPNGWPAILHVRARGDIRTVVAAIRADLYASDESLRFVRVQPVMELLSPLATPWRTGTLVFSLLGALGLALAAIGLYGVLNLLVAQRTKEIGVRLALGARGADVVRLVMGRGAWLVVAGLVLGGAAAAGASRFFGSMLYGVSGFDPLAYLLTAVVLTLVACFALWLPARRAARVDPMISLRTE